MVKNYLIATMLLFASAAMAQGTYPPLLKNRFKAHLEEKGDGAIWRPGTYVISTMNAPPAPTIQMVMLQPSSPKN